jgi:hypothetical protein
VVVVDAVGNVLVYLPHALRLELDFEVPRASRWDHKALRHNRMNLLYILVDQLNEDKIGQIIDHAEVLMPLRLIVFIERV